MNTQDTTGPSLEGASDLNRIPGHWVLAKMGKRVLRPGGIELTAAMLRGLDVTPSDHVVEFAPGLGATTRLVLAANPASYVGIERDAAAVRATERVLRPGRDTCRQGLASKTGLESGSATAVFGEAMLTMQTASQKAAIIAEAHRVLAEGGRYGIHELALAPDGLDEQTKTEIEGALSRTIHVGARPLTVREWTEALEAAGFDVISRHTAPMHLLEPARLVADEGWVGALRLAARILRTPAARRRVFGMRSVFKRYERSLLAVTIVARKRSLQ